MSPALWLQPMQSAQLRRSRSLDSGLGSSSSSSSSSSSPSNQRGRTELPPNEGPTNREETTRSPARNRHSKSKSSDDGRRSPGIHPEFLEVLKRRSLPHAPSRSSSLTLPPELPPDDDSLPSHKRGPEGGLPPRPRRWRELWTSIFSGWRASLPPGAATQDKNLSLDGGSDDAVVFDDEDVELLGSLLARDKENISPSEAREVSDLLRSLEVVTPRPQDPTPPPSKRYRNPLSFLWIYRQVPHWRPDVHPLVYGARFFNSWGGHGHDTLLDIGCEVLGGPSLFGLRLGKPFPEPEEAEEVRPVVEEARPVVEERVGRARNIPSRYRCRSGSGSGFAGGASRNEAPTVSHIEDARAPSNPNERERFPALEAIDPTPFTQETRPEPVRNPPRLPRRGQRSVSLVSNTVLRIQRLDETISRSQTQEFAEAALLLGLTIERKFGRIAEVSPEAVPETTSEITLADITEAEEGEDTSIATGTIVDIVEVIEEGSPNIARRGPVFG